MHRLHDIARAFPIQRVKRVNHEMAAKRFSRTHRPIGGKCRSQSTTPLEVIGPMPGTLITVFRSLMLRSRYRLPKFHNSQYAQRRRIWACNRACGRSTAGCHAHGSRYGRVTGHRVCPCFSCNSHSLCTTAGEARARIGRRKACSSGGRLARLGSNADRAGACSVRGAEWVPDTTIHIRSLDLGSRPRAVWFFLAPAIWICWFLQTMWPELF